MKDYGDEKYAGSDHRLSSPPIGPIFRYSSAGSSEGVTWTASPSERAACAFVLGSLIFFDRRTSP